MLRKKLFFFFYRDRNVRASLQDTVSSAFVTRLDSLGDSSGCNEALGNDELGSVHAVVVFSVCYGGFQATGSLAAFLVLARIPAAVATSLLRMRSRTIETLRGDILKSYKYALASMKCLPPFTSHCRKNGGICVYAKITCWCWSFWNRSGP